MFLFFTGTLYKHSFMFSILIWRSFVLIFVSPRTPPLLFGLLIFFFLSKLERRLPVERLLDVLLMFPFRPLRFVFAFILALAFVFVLAFGFLLALVLLWALV